MSHCTNSNMLCAFLFCQCVFNKNPCVHAYDCIFLVCGVCVFAHSLWGLGPSINITEGKTSLPLVRLPLMCCDAVQIRAYFFICIFSCFLHMNMHEDFLLYLCFCACIWIIKFLLVHLCCHACLCVRPLNSLNVNQRSFPLWWSWYVTNGHPSKLETFGLSASEERVVFVYFSFPCVIVACNMLLYLSMFDFSSDCVRADFSGSGNISQGFCLMLCTTALWGWCFAQADRHSSCFGLVFGPFYALLLPIAVYCVCVCLCLSFGFVWCLQ